MSGLRSTCKTLRRVARHGFRREDGQIIVLVAVSMALVMILAAIVVDAGHAFVAKNRSFAQNRRFLEAGGLR